MMRTRDFLPILFTLLLVSGCDTTEEDSAPEIIPSEVFSLDADLFSQDKRVDEKTKANFAAAALRVWPTSLVLSAHLILPAAITAGAAQARPSFDGGSWFWISTMRVNGVNWSYTLEGTPQGGGNVNWTMRITGTDPDSGELLTDFVLYEATTNSDTHNGQWRLYYLLEGERTEVLRAQFTYIGETEKNLTFTLPTTGPPNDTVSYSVDGDDVEFSWTQAAAGQSHLIRWNRATGAGYIESSNYNGGMRSCWDANHDDGVC